MSKATQTIDETHYLHPDFVVPQLPDLTEEQIKRIEDGEKRPYSERIGELVSPPYDAEAEARRNNPNPNSGGK